MNLQLRKRSAALAGALCAGAGLGAIPVAASASSEPPAVARPAAVSACSGRDVVVTAAGVENGLTHVGLPIVLRNVGAASCSISGYPGVVALDAAGRVVAHAKQEPSGYFGGLPNGGTIPPLVVIAPHQQASALVGGFDFDETDPHKASCPAYAALLVTPPGTSVTTRIVSHSALCSGLEVSPLVPGTTGSLTAGAENLVLTSAVKAALVAAAAAYWKLPPSAFSGLNPGTAYYAYDVSTQTYWAGAGLIPSPSSQEAGVVVQDDGGYVIFHRPGVGGWQAQEDGLAGAMGVTCAKYHVSVPAAVLAVWDWPPGTCTPPVHAVAPTTPSPSDFALAKAEWIKGATAISATQGFYWVTAAKDLLKAAAAKLPGTSDYPKAAKELEQLARLPDAMQSPAQQKEYVADVKSLNAFFGTKGLYL